jgi:hypothetical protein
LSDTSLGTKIPPHELIGENQHMGLTLSNKFALLAGLAAPGGYWMAAGAC